MGNVVKVGFTSVSSKSHHFQTKTNPYFHYNSSRVAQESQEYLFQYLLLQSHAVLTIPKLLLSAPGLRD